MQMKRWLFPALALVLAGAAVVQARSSAVRKGARSDGAAPAAARPPSTVRVIAEGRLVAYPGAEVVVGTDRLGRVEKLHVQERSTVRRGDVIAELDADDVRAALAEAEAQVNAAVAELNLAEVEINRAETLLARDLGTQSAVDRARRDRDAARARSAAAGATVERLGAVLAKSRILAPIDGVVLERYVDPGETLREGDRIVKVADLGRVRIEAEVDEFDAGRVVLAAPVVITAEGYDGQEWRGYIEEIPDAVVERGLQPRDPGRPTDIRVLKVKIAFDGATPLRLGQRVEVRIEIRVS